MAASPRIPVAPFLVTYGGENLLLDRDIERVRAWRGREFQRFDGKGMDDYEIVSLCQVHRDKPQTIVVDNANKLKGTKELKAYIADTVQDDLSVVLVGVIRSDKLPEVWGSVGGKGKVYERKQLKPWDSGSQYVKWSVAEATRLKVKFDKGVEQLFYQYVGADLYSLANELKKLARLVGLGGKITKADLLLVTTPTLQADPFQVAEAAMAKNPKGAMNALSILFKNSGEQACIPIVYALMKQVEKTMIIRRMLDTGMPQDEIAVAVGMKPWPLKNFAMPIARKHDWSRLVQYMKRLCKLDADVKGPASSKRTLVELTVLAIAG